MEFRKSEYLSSGLLKLICVPLFFLAFCLDISARRTQSGWNANLCSFSEAYRAEGWKIPGLLGAKKKTERASLSTHPEVFATMLDPGESEVELMSPKCPREFPGRLTTVGIQPLQAYDDGDRMASSQADKESLFPATYISDFRGLPTVNLSTLA
jgi:hypothetical protein